MDKKYEFLPDSTNEGRDKAFVDVDRFINEGMSGGSVHLRDQIANIEEAIDMPSHEEPPRP
ncbi:hypothetical protein [Rossellomorea marisflavi]|uniref:Uncharacterized protein n=1 Tax=Rossellomorea marisflavi TaxID=189381 RepID=A0A0J5TGK0_9BACI|nr:hypothetical protein [Rossellomorea marisflavi]KMK96889.1 hypothetical protein VL03_04695 [Rossellomorea marisflavi]KML06067.1 hypothetical protein VL06_08085 [Rossellomorea marisflavi]KML33123.1 hypothetical protein VL12_11540 [Rossellomorea marisflavi]KZE47703.1 hypothetical protein AV649_21025 [Rossellomorea marisflavi]QHA35772.1 hypothetical protein D5E69_08040 [Rossellomorea marisflavi]